MSLKTATDVDPIKSERTGNVREVGSQAIWSLSSCKPGKNFTDYPVIISRLSLRLHIPTKWIISFNELKNFNF